MLLDLGHIQQSPVQDAGSREIRCESHTRCRNPWREFTLATKWTSSYRGVAETVFLSVQFPIYEHLLESDATLVKGHSALFGSVRLPHFAAQDAPSYELRNRDGRLRGRNEQYDISPLPSFSSVSCVLLLYLAPSLCFFLFSIPLSPPSHSLSRGLSLAPSPFSPPCALNTNTLCLLSPPVQPALKTYWCMCGVVEGRRERCVFVGSRGGPGRVWGLMIRLNLHGTWVRWKIPGSFLVLLELWLDNDTPADAPGEVVVLLRVSGWVGGDGGARCCFFLWQHLRDEERRWTWRWLWGRGGCKAEIE